MLGFADFDDFLGWCFRGYTQQQYAEASAEVEGSTKLLEWAKAEPTGVVTDIGPQYRIDLLKSPI